ncbi:hypothetical protein HRbin36_00826 [bacterium HR36]|nr:hypothetical protein HRbin36_00826 [bacterium HR36]
MIATVREGLAEEIMLTWLLTTQGSNAASSGSAVSWEQIAGELQSLGMVATGVALAWAIAAVLLLRSAGQRWRKLWPGQRWYAVSWGVLQVLMLMLVSAVVSQLITETAPWPKNWAMMRFVLASACQALIYVWVPMRLLEIPPYQLGWHLRRWREDVVLGGVLWIPAMSVTLAVWAAALQVWPASDHGLFQELREAPSWPNWVALTLTAVCLAPLAEEAMFRGLLLRKMADEPFWADLTMLTALLAAIVQGYGAKSWGPLLFLVTAGPGYLAFEWMTARLLPKPGLARAVFASSLIFAFLHAQAWPSPIPLFFLAIILGIVAARTQSLLAPLLIHAAFNFTTVMTVWLQRMGGS